MEFNLIEGTERESQMYEAFKQDYIENKLSLKEIQRKYDIGATKCSRLSRKVREETDYVGRANDHKYYRSYTTQTGEEHFIVLKYANEKYQYYGTYQNEKDVQRIVEKLRECNWDKSRIEEIEKTLNIRRSRKYKRKDDDGNN